MQIHWTGVSRLRLRYVLIALIRELGIARVHAFDSQERLNREVTGLDEVKGHRNEGFPTGVHVGI